MSIVDQIVKQAEALRSAEASLKTSLDRYAKVKGLGGQQGYSVTIDGVTVQVAEMDRYYAPKLIRGREMIHLGALKALDAEIDRRRDNIKACRLALALLSERLTAAARGEA